MPPSYKQRQQAKRLKKLQEREEKRRKLKYVELYREIDTQHKKRGELEEEWRNVALKIAGAKLIQDNNIFNHTFQRAYDTKDHVIAHILKLLYQADEKYQTTIASFCILFEKIINDYFDKVDALAKANKLKIDRVLKLGEFEAGQIRSDFILAEDHLQLMIFFDHFLAERIIWTRRGENYVKKDEYKGQLQTDREKMQAHNEEVYYSYWEEYCKVIRRYIENIRQIRKEINALRKKDNATTAIIAFQGRKIKSSYSLIRFLRSELEAYSAGEKQAAFRDRRDKYRTARARMRDEMNSDRKYDYKILDVLVEHSTDITEFLETSHTKVEKILALKKECRKYETQKEKIFPYGSVLAAIDDTFVVKPKKSVSSLSFQATQNDQLFEMIPPCQSLWRRIAEAELTKTALIREKDLLIKENREMCLALDKIEMTKKTDTLLEAEIIELNRKCSCNNPNPISEISIGFRTYEFL